MKITIENIPVGSEPEIIIKLYYCDSYCKGSSLCNDVY